jgi:DNA-3-methyladenine glycosylase II
VGDVRLAAKAPFHLEATVRVLQRRPSNPVDLWEQGRYFRVLTLTRGLALVEVHNRGTIDDPDIRLCVRCDHACGAAHVEAVQTVRKILGLDLDPAPLQSLSDVESTLCATVLALRGMRPPRFANLFEAFASVVPFQQLSLDAGVAIVARLVRRFGQCFEHGGRRLYAFPASAVIGRARVQTLRACGLSSRKAEVLRYLARSIASGQLTEEELSAMTTNNALSTLAELPGIGPWSAGLVLLRGLGRTDVFPPGDVGALRGLRGLLHLGPRARLDQVVERFGNHRGYLYFCILGQTLRTRGLIHAAPQ